MEFSLDMRHKGQINEVELVLDMDPADPDFDAMLAARFYERYEQLYGSGSSFRGARLEIVTYRVRATADTQRPSLRQIDLGADTSAEEARRPSRNVYWEENGEVAETAIYDGSLLKQGQTVSGPAVVETPDTAVVVRPGQELVLDRFGNFELTFEEALGASNKREAHASLEA